MVPLTPVMDMVKPRRLNRTLFVNDLRPVRQDGRELSNENNNNAEE